MYTFFLVVHALVAAILVVVILMQQSEGGGLVGGGNSGGLMTARGAANFLTRATTVLALMFVSLSIVLAAIAIADRAPAELDTSLSKKVAPAVPALPASAVPMAGSANSPLPPVPANQALAFPEKPRLEGGASAPDPKDKVAQPAQKPRPSDVKPAASKVTPPPLDVPTGNGSQ